MALIPRPNIQIYTYFQNVAPNITPANLPELIIGPNYQVVTNKVASVNFSPAFGLTTAYIGQASNTVADPTTVTGSYLAGSSILNFPWVVFSGTNATLDASALTVTFSSTQPLAIVPALSEENVPGDILSISYPVGLAGNYNIVGYSYNSSTGVNTITLASGTLPTGVVATTSDVAFSVLAQSVIATSSTITFPRRYTMINPTSSGTLTGTITYSGAGTTISITSTFSVITSSGHVVLISGSYSGPIYAVYPVTAATSSTLTINYTAAAPTSSETVVFKQVSLMGSVSGTVYESYKALNQFQSAVTVSSISDINNYLFGVAPNPADNPLALAAEFALANGITPVTVFGVPTNNMAGYVASEPAIVNNDVYTVVPLTQDFATQQALVNYVTSLNTPSPTQVERRIIVTPAFNQYTPLLSSISGSITDISSTTVFQFNGVLSPLPQVGNYIQIQTSSNSVPTGTFLISGVQVVNGVTQITSSQHFGLTGLSVVANIVAVMTPLQMANWLASYGQTFASTQVNSLVWDSFYSNLGGVTYILPMYYAAAGLGAMIASLPPQQQFNGLSIAGVSGILHSNTDLFSRDQEDIIAGGGNIMLITQYGGGPVIIRNQLNTSVTSIQQQSLNIVKDIDFVKRMIRANVSNFLRATNATPAILPYISAAIDGIINYCKKQVVPNAGPILEFGAVNSIQLVNDGVTVDVTLRAPYPLDNMTFNLYVQ